MSAATSSSDFRNVRAYGLIAMKLDEGDRLIGVATCREGDDVLLATQARPVHPLPDHRRQCCACSPAAIRPACAASSCCKDDEVISLSVLRHVEASPDVRAAYLKQARRSAERRGRGDRDRRRGRGRAGRRDALSEERFDELRRREEFLLTVTERASASAARPTIIASPAAAGRASPI